MTMLGWTRVVEESGLEPGRGRLFDVRGVPVAVFRTARRVHALGAVCPHEGNLLSDCLNDDGTALCPAHGWAFRLDDGACTVFRTSRVPVYPVRVVEGHVWVRVRAMRSALRDLFRKPS